MAKNEKVKSRKEMYVQTLPVQDKLQAGYLLTKEDVLTEEGLLLVQCLVRDGLTMEVVAKTLGVTPQTFWGWRQRYPELEEACRKGKQLVDYQVENALLKAALGYKTESVKTVIGPPDKDGNREVKVEKTNAETGPNVTACLAWLNNRKPEQWRRNRDASLELDDEKSGITINIIKGRKNEEEDEDEDEI